ncbi:MAG: regulatory protein RecX [Halieaceae bacterium]
MSDTSPLNDFHEDELAQLSALNPADIRIAAMDYLTRREHSQLELRRKLKKRFNDDALIEQQLERLVEENLQSDSRYAESFVRQRFNRGHGPLRIRQEMRQRGVPDGDIQQAMEAENFDWYGSAQAVLTRKYGDGPAEDLKQKAKRSRFMQYRGFSPEHFKDLV